jgi:FKBP-type peptidyl-prolyl cis-trans isomerase SlyD
MSMEISAGRRVRLRYRLRDAQGEPIEDGDRELTYVHGEAETLLPAIEERLTGETVGARLSLHLEPEDAFGDYDAELVHLADRSLFPEALEAGFSFEGLPGQPDDGRIYIVTDFTDETVVLDGNHPLAGMALRFEIEVLEVAEVDETDEADGVDGFDDPADGTLH